MSVLANILYPNIASKPLQLLHLNEIRFEKLRKIEPVVFEVVEVVGVAEVVEPVVVLVVLLSVSIFNSYKGSKKKE